MVMVMTIYDRDQMIYPVCVFVCLQRWQWSYWYILCHQYSIRKSQTGWNHRHVPDSQELKNTETTHGSDTGKTYVFNVGGEQLSLILESLTELQLRKFLFHQPLLFSFSYPSPSLHLDVSIPFFIFPFLLFSYKRSSITFPTRSFSFSSMPTVTMLTSNNLMGQASLDSTTMFWLPYLATSIFGNIPFGILIFIW